MHLWPIYPYGTKFSPLTDKRNQSIPTNRTIGTYSIYSYDWLCRDRLATIDWLNGVLSITILALFVYFLFDCCPCISNLSPSNQAGAHIHTCGEDTNKLIYLNILRQKFWFGSTWSICVHDKLCMYMYMYTYSQCNGSHTIVYYLLSKWRCHARRKYV